MGQSNELSFTSSEFLEESNPQLCQTMPIYENKKRGGPYSAESKKKRREEVYSLHFDYGYSARKISDTMKINRNTINSDISYLYEKMDGAYGYLDNETKILGLLQRLEAQRCRIRNNIDCINDPKERIVLEKLLLDVDSKLVQHHQRMAESTNRMWEMTIHSINNFFKEEKKDTRYLTLYDKIAVSEKAQKRIQEIIRHDKKKVRTF